VTVDGSIGAPSEGRTIVIDGSLPSTSGVLSQDESWSGVVSVTGDVVIPAGRTLTVTPGTQILFQALLDDRSSGDDPSRPELIVEGALVVEGSGLDPVLMTSNSASPRAGDWGGIRVNGEGTVTLRHVTIEYAVIGVEQRSYHSEAVDLTIEQCEIRDTSEAGIDIEAQFSSRATVSVRDCDLSRLGGEGISIVGWFTTVDAKVVGNKVREAGGDGIRVENSYGDGPVAAALTVEENAVSGVQGNGIQVDIERLPLAVVSVSTNTINGAEGWGAKIQLSELDELEAVRLAGNQIYENSLGGLQVGIDVPGPSVDGNKPVVSLRGNEIYRNGTESDGHGVEVALAAEGAIAEVNLNRIHGNRGDGLRLITAQSADLVFNTIQDNGETGLNLAAAEASDAHFNNFGGNGEYDVYNASGSGVRAGHNWWGSAGASEPGLADDLSIFDGRDDSDKGIVTFAPLLSDPVELVEAPTSGIRQPGHMAGVPLAPIRVTGSASATTPLARVEVSSDGGHVWHEADGTLNWVYDWVPLQEGVYELRSRAVAQDGTVEMPGKPVNVLVKDGLATTSGSLSSNETWSGEVTLTGDVTVPEDVTLTLAPNTVVRFQSLYDDRSGGGSNVRSELIVKGKLVASGTSAAPIPLTSRSGRKGHPPP